MRTDALGKMIKEFDKKYPGFEDDVQETYKNLLIGKAIHDARVEAGLTQDQLADLVGMPSEVIVELENTDYEGDSLSMLQRIATALKKRVDIRLVPAMEG